jgi:hypothetical protein
MRNLSISRRTGSNEMKKRATAISPSMALLAAKPAKCLTARLFSKDQIETTRRDGSLSEILMIGL